MEGANLQQTVDSNSKKNWWNKCIHQCKEYLSFSNTEWVQDARSPLMIVATLIAIMTFALTVNPPGGVWQNSEHKVDGFTCSEDKKCVAGTSVLAYQQVPTKPILYPFEDYLYFNTVTFLSSLSVILLLISGFPLHNKLGMWLLTIIMCITLTFLVLAYLVGMTMVAGRHNDAVNTAISIMNTTTYVWIVLLAIVVFNCTIRLLIWIVRKKLLPLFPVTKMKSLFKLIRVECV